MNLMRTLISMMDKRRYKNSTRVHLMTNRMRIGKNRRNMIMMKSKRKIKKIRAKNQKKRLLRNRAPKRRLPHRPKRNLQPRSQLVRSNLYQNRRPSNLLAKYLPKDKIHLLSQKKKKKRMMLSWKILLNKFNNSNKKI